jgi:hypothetical protein
MKKLTITGSEIMRDVAIRDGFEMVKIEYPHLWVLNRFAPDPISGKSDPLHNTDHVLINIRGKHHASWWMKGKREEFGIPATEFATYTEMAKNLGVPLYFVFYEEVSKTISYIASNEVLMKSRIWDKDNVDVGGTLFVPKRVVVSLARVEGDRVRYINSFRPLGFDVQSILEVGDRDD